MFFVSSMSGVIVQSLLAVEAIIGLIKYNELKMQRNKSLQNEDLIV